MKELLGPRKGPDEQLPFTEEPRHEYLLGQLFPPSAAPARAPEEEQALGTEGVTAEGDEDSEGAFGAVSQAFVESGQNFRRVPSSLGISFLCDSMPAPGEINVCATWARYKKIENVGWKREPKFFARSFGGSEDDWSSSESLRLTYKATKIESDKVKISIFASSDVISEGRAWVSSEEIIFQPEIRVVLADRLKLLELGDAGFTTSDEEWRLATRQYDEMTVFARGHLCGAYWKQIDPQRPYDSTSPVPEGTPFEWADGKYLSISNPELQRFLLPDVRTDFAPLYYIPSPKIDESLEFRADVISNQKSFATLAEYLDPLLIGYAKWIKGLVADTKFQKIDSRIIELHEEALARMLAGLSTLKNDNEAFNSFLFMNKAMAMQYSWGKPSGREVMKWRPFQLAFILVSLTSTIYPDAKDREICDTIWFPTGGGKTEAYLGLAAFALAYRRRKSAPLPDGSKGGEGTCVISRYTLRLLTIQQYRRALKMVMACEILRCKELTPDRQGWIAPGMTAATGFVWGRSPFSIGLWVGYSVTPSAMTGKAFAGKRSAGATDLLSRDDSMDTADPAQVIECPCCSSILGLPTEGLVKGTYILHLPVTSTPRIGSDFPARLSTPKMDVVAVSFKALSKAKAGIVSFELVLKDSVKRADLSRWWDDTGRDLLGTSLCSFKAARPGYIRVENARGKPVHYEIRCPNPDCTLNKETFRSMDIDASGDWSLNEVHPWYASEDDSSLSVGIPINAVTVDEDLYARPASMVVGTCDKVASIAFKSEASSLFGRVRSYAPGAGYSQESPSARRRIAVPYLAPPSLIIQDELHLLEGPLGSSFGLYETTVEYICGKPKYIASSATIRNASEQIRALMSRENKVFPPVNLNMKDGFFLKAEEAHQLDERSSGRLFLGLGFPGRAPQTPMLRIWGRLLQTGSDLQFEGADQKELDPYWTLIGYFNAVRELAQGEALLRQDIPQFLSKLQKQNPGRPKRDLPDGTRNLSSQTPSNDLPAILAALERTLQHGDPLNAVSSTSMFGTGVDVPRLSLMVVHGQPKSASQYIQAVGRIGRVKSGLAVVFFRVSKPRDLNHYEYFTGYHRRLPVSVEPISVMPLAPKALDRLTGGLLATLVRHWRNETLPMPEGIESNDGALLGEKIEKKVQAELIAIFEKKYKSQPELRRPHDIDDFLNYIKSKLEKWMDFSRQHLLENQPLPYARGLVCLLGEDLNSVSVFPNTPRSLREVEPTINIHVGR
jgi:hypothetical protein